MGYYRGFRIFTLGWGDYIYDNTDLTYIENYIYFHSKGDMKNKNGN